jgi:serine/threonine protein kinase
LANKGYSERESQRVVQQILSALQYLHSQGIVHRDIKCENVMLDRHGNVKLIDLGLATKYLGDDYSNLTDMVGTLYSMAPQVLEGTGYDAMCDIWVRTNDDGSAVPSSLGFWVCSSCGKSNLPTCAVVVNRVSVL